MVHRKERIRNLGNRLYQYSALLNYINKTFIFFTKFRFSSKNLHLKNLLIII
jgi:hypothetical protein